MSDRTNNSAETDCPPLPDGLAREMVAALDQIIHRMMEVAPPGCEVPLTFQEVRAIKTIAFRGSLTMSALAGAMGISLPTATHIADRLVAKGMAVRIRPEHDRRLVLVTLSEQSQEHQRLFFENRVGFIRGILEPLPEDVQKQAARALAEIARVLQVRGSGQPATPTPGKRIDSPG